MSWFFFIFYFYLITGSIHSYFIFHLFYFFFSEFHPAKLLLLKNILFDFNSSLSKDNTTCTQTVLNQSDVFSLLTFLNIFTIFQCIVSWVPSMAESWNFTLSLFISFSSSKSDLIMFYLLLIIGYLLLQKALILLPIGHSTILMRTFSHAINCIHVFS